MAERIVNALVTVLATLLLIMLPCSYADARITKILIQKVTPLVFHTQSSGKVIRYERLDGIAYGEVNPTDRFNSVITDIHLAPRNGHGMVEYSMTFSILKPVDMGESNHVLLYEVVNRGLPLMTRIFNSKGLANSDDGFLEGRGYTLVWSGWEGDILPGPGRMTITLPIARKPDGSAIAQRIVTEYNPYTTTSTEQLGNDAFAPSGVTMSYRPVSLNNSTAILTERVHRDDVPVVVPRSDYTFADCSHVPFPGTPSSTQLCLRGGFDSNHIYELSYIAKDPPVLGLGFAATRDVVAFLARGDRRDPHVVNPLKGEIRYALAHGTSQSGRMLREFVALGFNEDELHRRVFDGINPHVASMRVNLNERFGEPVRYSIQHDNSDILAIADAPLTWGDYNDPISGTHGGLLDRCRISNTCPKIIQTVSGTEYWQAGMSLDTTDAHGTKDLPIPSNVRIYYFASTEHAPAPQQLLSIPMCRFPLNSNPYAYQLRALLVDLTQWVSSGRLPPQSRYPTIGAGTLKPSEHIGFPIIPGVAFSALVNPRDVLNWGPGFRPADESGVLREPPTVVPNAYTILVPSVDSDGNDIGGIRSTALSVPLGTYTGWNYRAAGFGEGDLCDLYGSFIPFERTHAERNALGDPRPSLEERYPTHADYVQDVTIAAERLVQERLMLPADAQLIIGQAKAANIP